MQERSAPRDFKTVTGMIGSAARYSSMRMNVPRTRREITIGIQRILGDESP